MHPDTAAHIAARRGKALTRTERFWLAHDRVYDALTVRPALLVAAYIDAPMLAQVSACTQPFYA